MPSTRLRLLLVVLLQFAGVAACYSPRPFPTGPGLVGQVDPLIGTGISTRESTRRHSQAVNEPLGQTVPAVGHPYGLTHWTPQTTDGAIKCVSPYYYFLRHIQGFRASHWMSGSCTQDYGSVTLMPVTGALRVQPVERASRFSHRREQATPAYYAATLEDYGVHAELTGTARAGMLRLTFTRPDPAYVVVNPNSLQRRGYVEVRPEAREIVGYNPVYRIYQGGGRPAGFSGHFVVRFDRAFLAHGTWDGARVNPGATSQRGDSLALARGDSSALGAYVRLAVQPGDTVHVEVGTSFTSVEEARRNLDAEIADRDFDAIRSAAETAWNEALGAVVVTGGTMEQRAVFHTALYHAMLLPRTFNDASGTYPGFADDERVHRTNDFTYYDDFSLWDTHRALHPLLTLVAPERTRDMIRSLLAKAEQGGWLPIFPAWNSYTSAMIGDHAIAMIADAYVKGIRDIDAETAYAYMRRNALESPTSYAEYVDGKGRRALDSYLRYGFIPLEDSVKEAFHRNGQVSRTLEYAYDDFALAQMARALGKESDYQLFLGRAANWRNVFDPSVRFVRGRHADGSWDAPFDPARRYSYLTEGTSWQYTWSVPHDVAGLIEAMGGREAFVARLDTLFASGHYWQGNEPSHHIAYLYAYAGAPWKTQHRVRELMRKEYDAIPGGLSGNDDAGQMSAWYVFSALGLYPAAPGLPHYVLGSPLFPEATLRVGEGRRFTILARDVSARNRYVQSARLNGVALERPWLAHSEVLAGGTLELEMGPEANRAWGSDPEAAPPSMSRPCTASSGCPIE